MYRDTQDTTVNMEYLFNMTNPNVGGADPPLNQDPIENSLFNLNTLKALVKLGMNTPDIVNNPQDKVKVLGTNFTLDEWADIAATLELNDVDDETVGKKRAYMIWLWLNTAY